MLQKDGIKNLPFAEKLKEKKEEVGLQSFVLIKRKTLFYVNRRNNADSNLGAWCYITDVP